MAILDLVDLHPAALWPQGDIRDPLGVWGARVTTTGDASGSSTKVGIQVPASLAGAYVYTCYSVTIAGLARPAGQVNDRVKCRLLTNWPNIDPAAGVQGFSTLRLAEFSFDGLFTSPSLGILAPLLNPNDRYLLLFDPRQGAGAFTIVEMELGSNLLNDTTAWEAYGYFWDRSVLNAPGGPRHPGAS